MDLDAFDIAEAKGIAERAPKDSPLHQLSMHKAAPVWRLVLDADAPAQVPQHVVRPTLLRDEDPSALNIEFLHNRLRVTPDDGGEYHFVLPDARQCEPLRGAINIPIPEAASGWHIHCGPLDKSHRVLSWRFFPEGSA